MLPTLKHLHGSNHRGRGKGVQTLMFKYDKFLEFPINIRNKNTRLANIISTQYGGPHGELGASLRYLSQRYTMPDDVTKGLLTDIGTYYPKFSLCP